MHRLLIKSAAALTLSYSSLIAAGGLNFLPSSLMDATDARTHNKTTANVLYDLNQGGTAVSPDYSGSFTSFYHTRTNGSLFNTTVTCAGDGIDASGNPAQFEEDAWVASHAFSWLSGAVIPPSQDIFLPTCNVNIGNTGHVVDGWANSQVFPGGAGASIVTSWLYDAPRVAVTLFGASCPLDGQPLATLAESVRTVLFSELDQGNDLASGELDALVPGLGVMSGCVVFTVASIGFGECDFTMDAEACIPLLAKAVPLPAYAAGSMMFGLVAISYITGRRRLVEENP